MAFEEHKTWETHKKRASARGKYSKYYDRAVVAVTKNGDFVVSPTAIDFLGYPESVLCLYDHDGKRIGFAAADCDDYNAYKVTGPAKKGGNMSHIAASTFARAHNLIPSDGKTRVYNADKDGSVLSISLTQIPSTL